MRKVCQAICCGLLASVLLHPLATAQPPSAQTTAPRIAPLAGGGDFIRKLIEDVAHGEPDYDAMMPLFAMSVRSQLWMTRELFTSLGSVKSVVLKAITPQGFDTYAVTFDNGALDFNILADRDNKFVVTFVPPAYPPAERLIDDELFNFIRTRLEEMDFSGVVLVARDGKPVFTATRGLADREQGTPNKLDTRFRIASVTKPLTAVAVMQLVQAGKVRLDAPIGTYVKDYPNPDVAIRVTVHQLLTHTSGLGDIFSTKDDALRLKQKNLEQYVATFGPRPLEYTPGEGMRYSNYGYMVLGRLIEAISGQTYPDYMHANVFQPAGMTLSGFELDNATVEGRAKGYMWEAGGFKSNAETSPAGATSSGGAYSTAEDLLAFANALQSGKLLSTAYTRLLMEPKASDGYAYGFQTQSSGSIRTAEHTGGIAGANAALSIIDSGKAVIVVLSNQRPPDHASALNTMIHRRIKVLLPDGTEAQFVRVPGRAFPSEAQRVAAFETADKDHDGLLDREGFRAALQTLGFADQINALLARYDVNGDGVISIQEIRNSTP